MITWPCVLGQDVVMAAVCDKGTSGQTRNRKEWWVIFIPSKPPANGVVSPTYGVGLPHSVNLLCKRGGMLHQSPG